MTCLRNLEPRTVLTLPLQGIGGSPLEINSSSNLRAFIHSAVVLRTGIGAGSPIPQVFRMKDGGRGGIASAYRVTIDKAPNPQIPLQDHARFCRRAGDFGGQ